MTEPGPSKTFSERAVLRNGTPVLIRVVGPQDRARVVEAFSKLEPDSIYTRFFSMKKELSAAELDRVTTTDFEHYLALAASIGTGPDETLIGGASYTVLPSTDSARSAEVAFTIEEDYHGQGLASRLLALLVGFARAQGVERFVAEVLAGNASMLSVFKHSGLPTVVTSEHGVFHVTMDLRNPGEQR